MKTFKAGRGNSPFLFFWNLIKHLPEKYFSCPSHPIFSAYSLFLSKSSLNLLALQGSEKDAQQQKYSIRRDGKYCSLQNSHTGEAFGKAKSQRQSHHDGGRQNFHYATYARYAFQKPCIVKFQCQQRYRTVEQPRRARPLG